MLRFCALQLERVRNFSLICEREAWNAGLKHKDSTLRNVRIVQSTSNQAELNETIHARLLNELYASTNVPPTTCVSVFSHTDFSFFGRAQIKTHAVVKYGLDDDPISLTQLSKTIVDGALVRLRKQRQQERWALGFEMETTQNEFIVSACPQKLFKQGILPNKWIESIEWSTLDHFGCLPPDFDVFPTSVQKALMAAARIKMHPISYLKSTTSPDRQRYSKQ